MYAENFYIALYDSSRDALRFIYYIDTVNPDAVDPEAFTPMAAIWRGLTWYLIRDGQPLMGPTHALRRQVSGRLRIHGADSPDWLGVPMLRGSDVRCALVVQSYVDQVSFAPADQALLSFVGNHILTALERKQGQEQLEQRVQQRTRELADANLVLNTEVEERQRGERLQAALFRIAELSSGDGGDRCPPVVQLGPDAGGPSHHQNAGVPGLPRANGARSRIPQFDGLLGQSIPGRALAHRIGGAHPYVPRPTLGHGPKATVVTGSAANRTDRHTRPGLRIVRRRIRASLMQKTC